ncbi:VOC family protein [Asanoa sp. NPDC050611]|uniref:VOC family protein n=1 Tax=Asanoa sp. NPDC050611 TaxID=3157098 RepID=UPI0033F83827
MSADVRMGITVDCASPTELAAFWAEALHYDLAPPPAGFASWHAWYRSVGVPEEELAGLPDAPDRLVDAAGVGPKFWFQQVPEPKTVKNRLHLDLYVSGGRSQPLAERRATVEAEVARLCAAGATVFRVMDDPDNNYFAVVMQDPEGNEFCVS